MKKSLFIFFILITGIVYTVGATDFISINPISDKYVGDHFIITTTTNLPIDDAIFVEVYSSSFLRGTQTNGSLVSGTGFKPDEYIVTENAVSQLSVSYTARFNVFEGAESGIPPTTSVTTLPTPPPTPVETPPPPPTRVDTTLPTPPPTPVETLPPPPTPVAHPTPIGLIQDSTPGTPPNGVDEAINITVSVTSTLPSTTVITTSVAKIAEQSGILNQILNFFKGFLAGTDQFHDPIQ